MKDTSQTHVVVNEGDAKKKPSAPEPNANTEERQKEELNPSSPADTGTTPGSNAEIG